MGARNRRPGRQVAVAATPAATPAPEPVSVTNGELAALDAQLATWGKRSQSTVFSFRVRQARALLRPLVGAFEQERDAILADCAELDDTTGRPKIEPGPDADFVRVNFRQDKRDEAVERLNALASCRIVLPANVPSFDLVVLDTARIQATEPELIAVGPLLTLF